MAKRIAIIDVGTNTFHLILVEIQSRTEYKIFYKERIPITLGQGGLSKGFIADEPYQRGLLALTKFKKIIDDNRIDEILAVATSGIRTTNNGLKFVEEVKEKTGLKISVIDGDEEAGLIYLGIKSTIKLGSKKSLIIDIGGGSIEFIICDKLKMYWSKSFETGAQRLMDKFHTVDPIPKGQIIKMNEYLQEVFSELLHKMDTLKPIEIMGASGAFETFSEIYYRQLDPKFYPLDVPETEIDYQLCHEIYDRLIKANRAQRLAIPGMIEFRADMIVVSAIVVNFFLKRYQFKSLRVSMAALKEGVLARYLECMA